MALVDLDKLPPAGLIAQYVIECRNADPILPYMDYEVIDEWLAVAPDVDQLLLVLADTLPGYFDPDKRRTAKPRSLKGSRRMVLKRLCGGLGGPTASVTPDLPVAFSPAPSGMTESTEEVP